MSQVEFDSMVKSNPKLRVSENSASRGEDSARYERIRATENQLRGRERISKTKPKARKRKKTVAGYVSPHAVALAYLARHPDDIQGKQEHYDQVRVMDFLERFHPDIYEIAAAIPNAGKRSGKQGAMMIAEGLKPGYPDITIDEARGGYHGFRLELKVGANRASDKQKEYHEKLRARGYCVVLVWGFDAAMRSILEYWALNEGELLMQTEYR
ncbi:VRR-NUC domain-containing protein [Vibrio fluvialis]|nr:VRR-NUC domain-containing protein [Vibrio fluvialis]